MHRRAPFVLVLLALGAVCLLLWETVLSPGATPAAGGGGSGLAGPDDLLAAPPEVSGGPGLSGRGGVEHALAADGPGGTGAGPALGGSDGLGGGVKAGSVPFQGKVVGPRGAPARGVTILVSGPDGVLTLETDADGRFGQNLRPGRYALLFRSDEGGLMVRSWMVDGASEDDLEFALREPAAVKVHIQRGADAVAGAQVVLEAREWGALERREVGSGLDGVALFEGLIPGPYYVSAQVPDGPLSKSNVHAAAAATAEVRVRVPDGVVLRGLVRGGENGPGVGARVTLHTQARGSAGFFETVFETDPDGAYEVTVPLGRAIHFEVHAEGYAPWPDPRQSGRVLGSLRGLERKGPVTRDVSLQSGAVLRGRVLTEDKQPVPGLTLRFRMRRAETVTATTLEDGSYAVAHLNAGVYDLQIETVSYFPVAGQPMRVSIPAGAATRPVEFDVTVLGARRLAGVVVDAAGQGVPGARVWIVGGGRVVRSARDAGRELEAFTGEGGRWVIIDIPPDKNVTVRAAMGVLEADPIAAPWNQPPPEPLRLVLKGTGSLAGTVTDLRTRQPLPKVRVRIVPDPYDGRTGRTLVTDAQGSFQVEALLPGGWKLTPSRDGYLPAEETLVQVVREKETVLGLSLDPGEVFAGEVVGENGAPLHNARVRVSGRPDGTEKDIARAANTDARGAFRLTGFRQGVYRVTVYRNGYRTETSGDMRGGDESLRFVLRLR